MKSIKKLLTSLYILLLASMHAASQDSTSIINNNLCNYAMFPGGQTTWESYIKRNVDSTVPIKNRAKKGIYTVVVKFIISKDGSLSEIGAETNYGYGMEREVIRVLKKSKNWTPALQNSKPVYHFCRVMYTYTVRKRKLFGKKHK